MADTLREYYEHAAIPKTYRAKKPRAKIRTKATPKAERDRRTEVRQYCFARERGICRCCRLRPAASLHELRSRSVGGKVSRRGSVAVCGQLGNGHECHGLLQRKEIRVQGVIEGQPNAEEVIWFYPETKAALDWLKLTGLAFKIESPPMRDMEAE